MLKQKLRVLCTITLFFGIVLQVAEIYSDEKERQNEEVLISDEAHKIAYQELRNVINALAAPPEELVEDRDRCDYIFDCFKSWKDSIICQGDYYDLYIEDGQSELIRPMVPLVGTLNNFTSSKGSKLGFQKGDRISRNWHFKISEEARNNSWTLFHQQRHESQESLSREEIIEGHPHVQAIIYMSKKLKEGETSPTGRRGLKGYEELLSRLRIHNNNGDGPNATEEIAVKNKDIYPMNEEEIAYIKNNISNLSEEYIFSLLIRIGDSQEYVEDVLGKPPWEPPKLLRMTDDKLIGYYIQMPPLKEGGSPIAMGQIKITYNNDLHVVEKEFFGPKLKKEDDCNSLMIVLPSQSEDPNVPIDQNCPPFLRHETPENVKQMFFYPTGAY